MSALVFKIEQGKGSTTGKAQQTTQDTLKETMKAPGTPVPEEAAVDTTSEGAAPAAATPPEATPQTPAASNEPVTVQVDGPIGRVFTDALNKVLAIEGYLTMLPEDEPVTEADSVEIGHMSPIKKAPINLVQVYCWRTDAVNASDLVQLSNNITAHSDRTFVVALEAAATIKNAVGVLESLTCYPNVKVCYSLESAARYVKELACPRK